MAATVAAPLERRLGEIPGVTEITSSSSLGSTNITIQFDLNRSIDGAARDVQAALNAALTDLPGDLPTLPSMRKVNPSAAPIMILALTSKTLLPSAMYDVADSVVAQRIAQVDGVAEVSVNGAEQPAIRIRVNPIAIASMGVSMEDVRTAVANANAASPLGTFDGPRSRPHHRHQRSAARPCASTKTSWSSRPTARWSGWGRSPRSSRACATAARRPGSTCSRRCCWSSPSRPTPT